MLFRNPCRAARFYFQFSRSGSVTQTIQCIMSIISYCCIHRPYRPVTGSKDGTTVYHVRNKRRQSCAIRIRVPRTDVQRVVPCSKRSADPFEVCRTMPESHKTNSQPSRHGSPPPPLVATISTASVTKPLGRHSFVTTSAEHRQRCVLSQTRDASKRLNDGI